MSFESLRKSFRDKMRAEWAEPEPVAYQNAPFNRPSTGGWVRVTVLTGQGLTQGQAGDTVGGIAVRDSGLVSIQIFNPESTGMKRDGEMLDAVLPIYEHARFDGIVCYTATVTDSGVNNGWQQTNVTIPFRRTRNV